MLCHSVRSCHSPALSLYRSLVARLNFATGTPLGVYLTSGSLPRFPTRITLFTLFAMRDHFLWRIFGKYNSAGSIQQTAFSTSAVSFFLKSRTTRSGGGIPAIFYCRAGPAIVLYCPPDALQNCWLMLKTCVVDPANRCADMDPSYARDFRKKAE